MSIKPSLSDLSLVLKKKLIFKKRIYGGGNSEVFFVKDADDNSYCLKQYPLAINSSIDRLDREWQALKFLTKNGINNVPFPIFCDSNHNIAVYKWIPGERIVSTDITLHKIKLAISFLQQINKLKSIAVENNIPPASDAYFSLSELGNHISKRISQLENIEITSKDSENMSFFLKNLLKPFFEKVYLNAINGYKKIGLEISYNIDLTNRILSPSDFGFHNALLVDKKIFWLDFEYFGWDDPAKTISDFLLHPAMNLKEKQKIVFEKEMLQQFMDSKLMLDRYLLLLPIFGIKWCLILLNEFLPDRYAMRVNAKHFSMKDNIHSDQLNKAKNLYQKLNLGYEKKFTN